MKAEALTITAVAALVGTFLCIKAAALAGSVWVLADAEFEYAEVAKGRARSIAQLEALSDVLHRSPWQVDLSRAAFIEMRIAQQSGLNAPRSRARLAAARRDLEQGLKSAPADAYGWTRLAVLSLQLEGPAKIGADALSLALAVAPRERKLTTFHLDLGAAYWRHLDGAARDALLRRMAAAEKWPETKAALNGNSARALRSWATDTTTIEGW